MLLDTMLRGQQWSGFGMRSTISPTAVPSESLSTTRCIEHQLIRGFPRSILTTLGLTLPQSRLIENEADHIGLVLLSRACFDLSQAEHVREQLFAQTSVVEICSK